MACVQGFSSGDTHAPTPPAASTLPHPSVFAAMLLMAMSQQEHICLHETHPLHAISAFVCASAFVCMHMLHACFLLAKQTMAFASLSPVLLLCQGKENSVH